MKKSISLLVSLLCLSFSASAKGLTLADLSQHEYVVTAHRFSVPVYMLVKINEEGWIDFTEVTEGEPYYCVGHGKIINNVLESDMLCDDGAEFEQKIDLNTVDMFDGLSGFTANVFSSLWNHTFKMEFVNRKYTDK